VGGARRRRAWSAGALIAVAIALPAGAAGARAGASVRVLGDNGIARPIVLTDSGGSDTHCQDGTYLPAGTSGVRLWLRPTRGAGPIVGVTAAVLDRTTFAATRMVAWGVQRAGWRDAPVLVPFHAAVPRRTPELLLCMTLARGPLITFLGRTTRSGPRVRVEYLAGVPTVRVHRERRTHAEAALQPFAALLRLANRLADALIR
jgi:hypothetical protein